MGTRFPNNRWQYHERKLPGVDRPQSVLRWGLSEHWPDRIGSAPPNRGILRSLSAHFFMGLNAARALFSCGWQGTRGLPYTNDIARYIQNTAHSQFHFHQTVPSLLYPKYLNSHGSCHVDIDLISRKMRLVYWMNQLGKMKTVQVHSHISIWAIWDGSGMAHRWQI